MNERIKCGDLVGPTINGCCASCYEQGIKMKTCIDCGKETPGLWGGCCEDCARKHNMQQHAGHLIDLVAADGRKISIPVSKITGICHILPQTESPYRTFVATGEHVNDGENRWNGWHVINEQEEVRAILNHALESLKNGSK